MRKISIFLMLIIICSGCAGQKITSQDEERRQWIEQVECMDKQVPEDLEYLKDLEYEVYVVPFRVPGKHNDGYTVWLRSLSEGYPEMVGFDKQTGEEVIWIAGKDFKIYQHPKKNTTYSLFILYESGDYREALARHERVHAIICMEYEDCDSGHKTFWFKQNLCGA